jgi:DNA-binding Xre family transcriptional regulator
MAKVQIDLFPQIQKRETQIGRPLTSREIAHFSGVHETTISAYRSKAVKMVRLETLGKLAQYFECQPGDLLSMKEVS